MPRYFISTSDHVEVMDEEGIEVRDLEGLRILLRQTLTAILRDEGARTGVDEFTAKAFNAHGRLVMQARASFSITDQ